MRSKRRQRRRDDNEMIPDDLARCTEKQAKLMADFFLRSRDEVKDSLGAEYGVVISRMMAVLRADARTADKSLMQAFQDLVTYWNFDRDKTVLLAAAVAELYALRERIMPGVKGRG